MIVLVRLGLPLVPISATWPLTFELPDGATIEDLGRRIATEHPEHARGISSAMAIINSRQVGRKHRLRDRDEVTLMLPMVGG